MRFGLYFPNQGPFADVRLLVELAKEAEVSGWDGLFVWDALLPVFPHSSHVRAALGDSPDSADAFVAMTAIAAATERIRFGALVSPVPRLRPESFAQQTATLDNFSHGRLVVGAGLGSPDTQFSAFGYAREPRVRAEMADEFLDVVSRLWSGDAVDFHGTHYTAAGVSMAPPPLQRPRIPIWIGADHGRRLPRRRAARWQGFVPASPQWPTGVIAAPECAEIRDDIGRDDFDLVMLSSVLDPVPSPETLDTYAAAGVTWWLAQALTVEDARAAIARARPTA